MITREQIEALRIEAGIAGDEQMVETCSVALGEIPSGRLSYSEEACQAAWSACERVIADAAAQS